MDALCVICGNVYPDDGTGRWVCHADDDVTKVCRGPCAEVYRRQRANGRPKSTEGFRTWALWKMGGAVEEGYASFRPRDRHVVAGWLLCAVFEGLKRAGLFYASALSVAALAADVVWEKVKN